MSMRRSYVPVFSGAVQRIDQVPSAATVVSAFADSTWRMTGVRGGAEVVPERVKGILSVNVTS
jgi:hypothetical protein